MRPVRTIKRLVAGTREDLARAARDLGHELPRRRLAVLADFRAAVVEIQPGPDAFADGYRQALRDVTAAYEAEVEARVRRQVLRMYERPEGNK